MLRSRGFSEPVVEELDIENIPILFHAPLDTRVFTIKLHPNDIVQLRGVTLRKKVHRGKIRQTSSPAFKSWWCKIVVESGESFIRKSFEEFVGDMALLLYKNGFIGYCVIEVIAQNKWRTENCRSTDIIFLRGDSVHKIVLSDSFDKYPYPIFPQENYLLSGFARVPKVRKKVMKSVPDSKQTEE